MCMHALQWHHYGLVKIFQRDDLRQSVIVLCLVGERACEDDEQGDLNVDRNLKYERVPGHLAKQ